VRDHHQPCIMRVLRERDGENAGVEYHITYAAFDVPHVTLCCVLWPSAAGLPGRRGELPYVSPRLVRVSRSPLPPRLRTSSPLTSGYAARSHSVCTVRGTLEYELGRSWYYHAIYICAWSCLVRATGERDATPACDAHEAIINDKSTGFVVHMADALLMGVCSRHPHSPGCRDTRCWGKERTSI
jgi:hypothetical protein